MSTHDGRPTAIAAYEAAGIAFEAISTAIKERMRAGEMPSDSELLAEHAARITLVKTRRAMLLRFADATRD